LGEIESVRVTIGHRASPAFLRSWHTDPLRSGGGTLIDNGPHACDLIRLLLADIRTAFGVVRQRPERPAGCEMEAFALFRGAGQAAAELRSSWTLESGYLTLEVRGRAGFVHAGTAPWRLDFTVHGRRRGTRRYVGKRALAQLFRRISRCDFTLTEELQYFADAVAGRPSPVATAEDGCRVTEMVAAVYRSARLGREVSIRSVQSRPDAVAPLKDGKEAA
jgi:predicted dehydrogenase